MGFNFDAFESTSFNTRTETVPVPELKKWYDEGEKPVWVVQGLTAEQLAVVNEAVDQNKNQSAMLAAICSNVSKEKIDGIKEALGLSKDSVPNDIVRRIALLVVGSVPECRQDIAVKLGATFPTIFYNLTNKILKLTGQGCSVGE